MSTASKASSSFPSGGFGRHSFLPVTILVGFAILLVAPQPCTAAQGTVSSSTVEYAAELTARADAAWDNERYEDAANAYRQAFSVDPTNKRAAFRLGWCYNEQERYGEAIWVLKDAIKLDPADEKARTELGFAFRNAGRYQEALETYREILGTHPKSVDAHYYIGWIQNERGEYQEAIDALRKAVQLAPDRGEAFEDLGYAYKQTGKYEEAAEAYATAVSLEPKEIAPIRALGDIYFSNLKQYEKAASIYRESIKLNAGDTRTQYNLGWILNELGHSDAAVAPLLHVTQLEPRNVDAWNELGLAYRKLQKNDAALDAYSRSLKLEPDSAHANLGIADLYFYNLKDYKAAIDSYVAGIPFDVGSGRAYRNLGSAHNKLKQFAEAVAPLEKATSLLPEDSRSYLDLGIAYEGLDRVREAAASYKTAIRLEPQSTEAHLQLGLAWIALDDLEAARREYAVLVDLDADAAKKLQDKLP